MDNSIRGPPRDFEKAVVDPNKHSTRIAMASELDCLVLGHSHTHRIHGAGIYANIWGILY